MDPENRQTCLKMTILPDSTWLGLVQCICFYGGYHIPPPGVYGRFGEKRGYMVEGVYGSWRVLSGGIIWTHVGGIWMQVGGIWMQLEGIWYR